MTIATTAMRVMEVVRGINSDTHNHEVKKIRIKGRLLWRDPNVRLSEIRQAVLNRTTISVFFASWGWVLCREATSCSVVLCVPQPLPASGSLFAFRLLCCIWLQAVSEQSKQRDPGCTGDRRLPQHHLSHYPPLNCLASAAMMIVVMMMMMMMIVVIIAIAIAIASCATTIIGIMEGSTVPV